MDHNLFFQYTFSWIITYLTLLCCAFSGSLGLQGTDTTEAQYFPLCLWQLCFFLKLWCNIKPQVLCTTISAEWSACWMQVRQESRPGSWMNCLILPGVKGWSNRQGCTIDSKTVRRERGSRSESPNKKRREGGASELQREACSNGLLKR